MYQQPTCCTNRAMCSDCRVPTAYLLYFLCHLQSSRISREASLGLASFDSAFFFWEEAVGFWGHAKQWTLFINCQDKTHWTTHRQYTEITGQHTNNTLDTLENTQHTEHIGQHSGQHSGQHQCCTDVVSAIDISAISAKNIGIGHRQYYKMYIGNQNLTFLWENWP